MISIQIKGSLILLLDEADAWVLEKYSITADRRSGTWYVRAQEKGPGASRKPKLYLHRLLMSPPTGMDVDHKDGNGLNNQRSNLRVASRTQNSLNRGPSPLNKSGFKGVYWNAQREKWYARLVVSKVARKRGYFVTAEQAAAAYDALVVEHAHEFGRLNYELKPET